MLWPIKFALKLALRLRIVLVSVVAGMALAFYLQLREQQQHWGVVPRDVEKTLPGDDLIGSPDIVETRSLVVDAPPAAVWPWLVQMGWGRGGWYSYDRLDMEGSSADTVLEQFQDLAAGDVVPTHPGGGFVAKVVEPHKALVLYLDNKLVESQIESSVAEKGHEALQDYDERLPGGLQFAGALGGMTMPEFRGTWAFVLEPEGTDRTRLIERFRIWTADAGLPQKLGMPMMGLGVFAMTRRHMIGVKERAERHATNGSGTPEPEPVAVEV